MVGLKQNNWEVNVAGLDQKTEIEIFERSYNLGLLLHNF